MLNPTIAPTDEQIAITDLLRSTDRNILVRAYAGTGKTTTLDLIQHAAPKKPVLCLAFNKRIAEEMEKRFPSTTTVRTFNGLGHRVWGAAVGKISLDTKKTQSILKAISEGLAGDDRRTVSNGYWEILTAVGLAKALGYVPEGKFPGATRLISQEDFHASLDETPSPFLASVIDSILLESIKAAYKGVIDFNDQIYMPALFGGSFPRFPITLVDEYQDVNPTNIAMLKKLVAKGRVCAVGDEWQCIYAFRGAQSNAMEEFKSYFSAEERTISLSFRCPQRIVEAARFRVPGFRWLKAGGTVEELSTLNARDIPDGATILCRNNAPLFKVAFSLLAGKRSVSVSGSEVGPRIVRLLKKLGSDDDSRATVIVKIREWKEEKLQTANHPGTIADMAACMHVFAEFGETLGQAIAYAEHLFAQQGTIRLSTIHKAKGGEWDVVYLLDPWLLGDNEQELNLRYVATTRAKEAFYEIDSKGIKW